MWKIEISRQTTAKKEQIWNLWADVANWNSWDSTVTKSELYGDFNVGTKGMVKLAVGPKSNFVITDCKPFDTFTNRSFLPLCKVDFTLTLVETQNGTLVAYSQKMTGLLTFLFSKMFGKKMEQGLSTGIDDLVRNAEKSE
jgi:hypothetical protein